MENLTCTFYLVSKYFRNSKPSGFLALKVMLYCMSEESAQGYCFCEIMQELLVKLSVYTQSYQMYSVCRKKDENSRKRNEIMVRVCKD